MRLQKKKVGARTETQGGGLAQNMYRDQSCTERCGDLYSLDDKLFQCFWCYANAISYSSKTIIQLVYSGCFSMEPIRYF